MAQNEFMHQGFGPHLMLDLFGCPVERLTDIDFIFNVLDTFPEKIGMTKVLPPYVFKYHGEEPADCGVSGGVLIAESHISIHTFPDKQHVFIDIFSYKAFDTNSARDQLLELFKADHYEQDLLSRGVFKDEHKDLVGSRSVFH